VEYIQIGYLAIVLISLQML